MSTSAGVLRAEQVVIATGGYHTPIHARSILVVWYITCVRSTVSARRHGVSDEAIRHAVTNAIRLIDFDDGVFVIGADASGQMLELVARPTKDGDLVVFHAMPLRPINANRYLR